MIGQLSFPNGENGQLIDRIVASSLSGGFHFPSEATASRYPKNHHGLKDRYTSTSNILHRSVLYVLHVCSEIFGTCVTLRSNAGVSCLIHQLPGFFSILTRWLSHSNCECSMVSMVWRSRKSSISIHIHPYPPYPPFPCMFLICFHTSVHFNISRTLFSPVALPVLRLGHAHHRGHDVDSQSLKNTKRNRKNCYTSSRFRVAESRLLRVVWLTSHTCIFDRRLHSSGQSTVSLLLQSVLILLQP